MDNLSKLKSVLIGTIKAAGLAIIKDYNDLDMKSVKLKSARDLVTGADLKSEKIILDKIKASFPDHQILSEESGRSGKKSDYLWIIDPLDGTTNFFMHNPLWSVSIGLAYKGKMIMGAVYAPMQKELYHAVLGQGAYLNNKKITVNNDPIKSLNAFCHGREIKNIQRMVKYFAYQKEHSLDCRQIGSAAIETAYVAAGRLSSILIPGAWPWDVAAGTILIREAGGKVTDFNGREWNHAERDYLGASQKSHKKILKIIKSLGI